MAQLFLVFIKLNATPMIWTFLPIDLHDLTFVIRLKSFPYRLLESINLIDKKFLDLFQINLIEEIGNF